MKRAGLMLGLIAGMVCGSAGAATITISGASGWNAGGPTLTDVAGFVTITANLVQSGPFSATYKIESDTNLNNVNFQISNPQMHGFADLTETLKNGGSVFSYTAPIGSDAGPTENLLAGVTYTLTEFSNAGNHDGNVALSNNVSVQLSSVPLPGSLVLFGSVIAAAGAFMRRRNSAAVSAA